MDDNARGKREPNTEMKIVEPFANSRPEFRCLLLRCGARPLAAGSTDVLRGEHQMRTCAN